MTSPKMNGVLIHNFAKLGYKLGDFITNSGFWIHKTEIMFNGIFFQLRDYTNPTITTHGAPKRREDRCRQRRDRPAGSNKMSQTRFQDSVSTNLDPQLLISILIVEEFLDEGVQNPNQ